MNNVKTIRKDKKIDRRLKRHFKEDLQFQQPGNCHQGSQSATSSNTFFPDQETQPFLLAEGGDLDKQKEVIETPNDEDKNEINEYANKHFNSYLSDYDPEGGSHFKSSEYQETGTFCYCFSLRCGLIFLSLLLVLDFCFDTWETIELLDNTIFDGWYGDVYCVLLIIYIIGVILVFYYWCATDSPSTRSVLPWAFLIASIVNFLFAAWLCTYIFALYKREFVYVQRYTSSSNVDESQPGDKGLAFKYKKVTKVEYVLSHVFQPVIDGVVFLFTFFTAKGWVDRHAKQEKAYG